MMSYKLNIGYDYDKIYGYGIKDPITIDVSTKNNSHILLAGMSGSGKSYALCTIFAKISIAGGTIFFADYKQDEQYDFLRKCSRYYAYNQTVDALEAVYTILHQRQAKANKSKTTLTPVSLIWDEYVANLLAIKNESSKKADEIMRMVSEILMLGRSLSVRLIISCQRPDAAVFPYGSRINYGIIIILGAPIRSIYEMMIPKEYIDEIGDRTFGVGEGIVLLQGWQMRFIKIAKVKDLSKMQALGIAALNRE